MGVENEKVRFKAIGINADIHVVCTRYNAGDIPVCPKCGSDLAIAYSWKEANEFDMHPGIICLVDSTHFCILFNISAK